MEKAGFDPLPLTIEHGEDAAKLPRLHADPFDRMLIATAIVEGLTLVTADDKIAGYGIPLLSATASPL